MLHFLEWLVKRTFSICFAETIKYDLHYWVAHNYGQFLPFRGLPDLYTVLHTVNISIIFSVHTRAWKLSHRFPSFHESRRLWLVERGSAVWVIWEQCKPVLDSTGLVLVLYTYNNKYKTDVSGISCNCYSQVLVSGYPTILLDSHHARLHFEEDGCHLGVSMVLGQWSHSCSYSCCCYCLERETKAAPDCSKAKPLCSAAAVMALQINWSHDPLWQHRWRINAK